MSLLECIRLAFNSLLANKLRALLTMLGIIIGISSVIIITTLGNSVSKTLEYSFNSLGFNTIYVYADRIEEGDDYSISYMISDFFTKERLDGVYEKFGDRFIYQNRTDVGTGSINNFKDETINTDIIGVSNGRIPSDSYKFLMGRDISREDIEGERHSAVVSEVFVKQYFRPNENPIGKTVDLIINDGIVQSFTIVGVIKAHIEDERLEPGMQYNDLKSDFYIPSSTANAINGTSDNINFMAIYSIDPSYDHAESSKLLKEYFEDEIKHYPGGVIDYYDAADNMKFITVILTVITVVFTLIAMISLLVGGIGVMNIMLVSITERTREIGVRKAMGAKNGSIRLQFVVEAIMICVIGGIIGILLGIGEGLLVKAIADVVIRNFYNEASDYITLVVRPSVIAMVGSVLFCMATGVFFGLYPANKAAKMNPIDALRYD